MKIENGKSYEMRNGEKIRIVCTDRECNAYPVVGLFRGRILIFKANGENLSDRLESKYDIIREWKEKPVVDWDALPAWANWAAWDCLFGWRYFENKPRKIGGAWHLRPNCNYANRIPDEYAPKFDGDWKDSLQERPKAHGEECDHKPWYCERHKISGTNQPCWACLGEIEKQAKEIERLKKWKNAVTNRAIENADVCEMVKDAMLDIQDFNAAAEWRELKAQTGGER